MSLTLLIVIAFCATAGYWIVSSLLSPGRSRQTGSKPSGPRDGGGGGAGTAQAEADPRQPPAEPAARSEPAWHEVLQVSPGATMDAIQLAYRTLIRQYHPDKVANLGEELRALAEAKSKAINLAYDQARRERGVST